MSWVVVPNWERFQHYSDRDPIWIKNYTRLLADEDYLELSSHRRAVLHGLWLAYATSNGHLHGGTRSLSARLRLKVTTSDLESLNHAGFIEVSASRPLALAGAGARARTRSREEETEKEPPKKVPRTVNGRRVTGWREVRGTHGLSHVPDPFGTDKPPFDLKGIQ